VGFPQDSTTSIWIHLGIFGYVGNQGLNN
jgi:hypothetical protein